MLSYRRRFETVTEGAFTMNVTVAEPPAGLEIATVQVPAFCGVTRSVNERPVPLGGPNVTMAAAPVPHAEVSALIAGTATLVVTVTVCANDGPTPENVIALGDAESCPGGAATPVKNGGGLAPPPWHAASGNETSAQRAARGKKRRTFIVRRNPWRAGYDPYTARYVRPFRYEPVERAISRLTSRAWMSRRRSQSFFPRTSASSSLTRPCLK